MSTSFLRPALEYAELGWAIFPCLPGQKIPATQHGVKDATSDPEQIKRWWMRWPKANIAVACGEPSGFYVVDVDVTESGDVNGWESLEKIGQILPATVKQNTPRGGAHFFYGTDNPPANKNSFLPGIDIRSTGYYVVIAPSIHPNGKVYEWAKDCSPFERSAIETFPDFMRPKLAPAPVASSVILPGHHDSEVLDRASAYLETCDPAIQGEGGHDKLLWAAVAMVRGFLLSDTQAYDLLSREYNPRCVPPWNLDEPKDYKDFTRKISEARKLKGKHQDGWLLESDDYLTNVDTSIVNIKKLLSNIREPHNRLAEFSGEAEQMRTEYEYLTRYVPTGLLGDLCSWINATALRPQPFLTLGCALAFCGVLFGRKVRTPRGLRTNIYCMGIAGSSAGKDHAPNQVRKLCLEAGCLNLLGGDDTTSDSSIESRLSSNPATLFLWDEIGHLLSSIKSGQNKYTAKIVFLLMKLYSTAKSVYMGREYVDLEKRRMLIEPCCCVYGYSSPERFQAALSPEELRDGWLSRCFVFYADDKPRKMRNKESIDQSVPQSLIKKVRQWATREIQRSDNSNLAHFMRYHQSGIITEAPPKQIVVQIKSSAEKRFVDFDDKADKASRENPEIESLWSKAEENARKIALILAASECYDNPVITPAIADYSCRLIEYLLHDFKNRIHSITSCPIDAKKNCLFEAIQATGVNGCTQAELTRKSQWCYKRERGEILSDLIDAERIVSVIDDTGKLGRRAVRFWTVDNYLRWRKKHGKEGPDGDLQGSEAESRFSGA